MTAVDVDALDAARAAATAGPWAHHPADSNYVIGEVVEDEEGPAEYLDVADTGGRPPGYPGSAEADAALIVAAVNALPELLAEVRRGRALREAVEALHVPESMEGTTYCAYDGLVWPCMEHRTIAAVDAS